MYLNTLYILFFVVFLASILYLSYRRKFNRHKHNWKKAIQTIEKLNSFSGENIEGRQLSYLRKIDPFVFEEVLMYSMKMKGLNVIRNKRYTGDGGIDGKVIDKKGNKYLIQAKRYKSYINLAHVKEFGELVQKSKWTKKGLFIHTGKTGKGVYTELKNYPIQIVSGKKLIDLINNKE